MTKLLTPTKLVGTATLTLVAVVLTLTATAHARPTQPSNGSFTPTGNFLRTMVLGPTELAGFASISCPTVITDAADWAGAGNATIPALRAAGFEMGINEQFYSTTLHASASSTAVKFKTSTGALKDVADQFPTAREHGTVATFPVAGIPHAHGSMRSANGVTEYRIAFTEGTYEYGVAITFRDNPRTSSPARSEKQLLAAAQIIYHRAAAKQAGP